MWEQSTLPVRSAYNRDPATIFGILTLFTTAELAVPDEIGSVEYTIYEQESPEVNTETPVEYFENVSLPVDVVVQDAMKSTTVFSALGGKTVEYNTKVVIGPVQKTVDGATTFVYPFPRRGMFYRVEITFRFKNPAIPPKPQVEIFRAM